MKKTLAIILIVMSTTTLFAQQMPINIGIHGGVSNSKMKVKLSDYKSDAKTGYMLGAFVRLNLGLIYLEPSLNFSHHESEAKFPDGNFSLKFNSCDIPVMIGAYVLKLPLLKLRAFAGPVASFPGNMKDNIKDLRSKNFVWNGKIGAGIDVWKLTFDIDYEKGFSKFEDDLKSPRVFNFTLGLKII